LATLSAIKQENNFKDKKDKFMRKAIFLILFLIILVSCKTLNKSNISDDKNNYKLLFSSCKKGDFNIVKNLIIQGIDINHKEAIDEISDGTPLILCSMIGEDSIAELLLENGADVNIKNNLKETPLMLVSLSGSIKITELLLKNNAKINEQNQAGQTALIFAVSNKRKEIVEKLVKNKCDVNIKDNSGCSALMYAVSYNLMDNVKLLVENNADVNAQDKKGKKVLQFVNYWNFGTENNINIVINNTDSVTSINYDIKNAKEIEEYLKLHGAK
jgi:ankyrin repeat protein